MEWTSKLYNLVVSEEANRDIDAYIDYIIYECDAFMTAKKHYDGLIALLEKIQKNPTFFSIRTSASLLQYGNSVRRANYKKMAIIYTVNGFTIDVHRVVAASMIVD